MADTKKYISQLIKVLSIWLKIEGPQMGRHRSATPLYYLQDFERFRTQKAADVLRPKKMLYEDYGTFKRLFRKNKRSFN